MLRIKNLTLLMILPLLAGCQYASFFRTNTSEYPRTGGASTDASCMAMGAMRGDASYDACVDSEEQARGHGRPQEYMFPMSPNNEGVRP